MPSHTAPLSQAKGREEITIRARRRRQNRDATPCTPEGMSSRGSGNRLALPSRSTTRRSRNGSQRCRDGFPPVGKPDNSTAAGAVSGDSCAAEKSPWGPSLGLQMGVLTNILSARLSAHGTKCGILKYLTKADDALPFAEAFIALHLLSRGLSTLATSMSFDVPSWNHPGALPSTGGDFSFLRSDFRTVEKGGRENERAETRAGSWFRGASADFRSSLESCPKALFQDLLGFVITPAHFDLLSRKCKSTCGLGCSADQCGAKRYD
jgi:hypothetical protein